MYAKHNMQQYVHEIVINKSAIFAFTIIERWVIVVALEIMRNAHVTHSKTLVFIVIVTITYDCKTWYKTCD